MSGKRPKGSLYACRESMATADSHATTNHSTVLTGFPPCPELDEEVSAFKTTANTGYVSSSSDCGINSKQLHRLRFMPQKHLNHTKQNSLSTGSGESFTPRTPSPRRQERITRQGLGFDLGAWNARGLGIVTRQGQDKKALHFFGLVSEASRARKATGTHATPTQSFD